MSSEAQWASDGAYADAKHYALRTGNYHEPQRPDASDAAHDPCPRCRSPFGAAHSSDCPARAAS